MKVMKMILGRAMGLALMALSVSACDKDPVKPEDETLNKLHEDPAKVVYTLEKCSLPEDVQLSYATLSKVQISTQPEDKQTLVWAIKGDGTWDFTSEAKTFEVETVTGTGAPIYFLRIEYYSPSGEKMNHQFIQNGQDKIHQHVFAMYKSQPNGGGNMIVRDPAQLPYIYYYADKTNGQFTGERNPLGFEGYIQFTKPITEEVIKAELLHAYGSKYLEGERTSPFYATDRYFNTHGTKDISVALTFRERTFSSNQEGEESPSDESGEENPSEGSAGVVLPGVNTTNVHKIVLGLYDGHLHGMNFHYISGPKGLTVQNLAIEQVMTIERKGTQWEITSGSVNRFLMTQASTYDDAIGTPVYGLWVDLYDVSGNKLNGNYGTGQDYQIFFVPEGIKKLSDNTTAGVKPSEVYKYYYRDSTPWDRTSQDGGSFTGDTNPVGLKGFFTFPKGDLQFKLKLELWHTPQGKRANASDSFAQPYEVSSHIKRTGTLKLSVSVPAYVWLNNNTLGNIELDSELSSFPDTYQAIIQATCKLLGISWETLKQEREILVEGERGSENEGRWF